MDTQATGRRRLPRILTMAALTCFALPFLTVTCYGETTVSGVQAATEIDLYPNDGSGEGELFREESANGFALVALVAAVVGVFAAFGSAGSRRIVWASAVGAIALQGLFVYAFYRSWGAAWPRIGFTGALMLLAAASWAAVGSVSRWVMLLMAGVTVSMLPGTLIGIDDLPESPFISWPIYTGGFVVLLLAVGAIRASVRPANAVSRNPRPSTLRMVAAGIVGTACLAAAAVASPILMGAIDMSDAGPGAVVWGYVFGSLVVVITTAASVGAWAAGDAIVHGGRRARFARMRPVVGT
ncbi:MAG TPA: hypothetical protein VJ982_08495 [Gemmatimonadota bacterium]|nr:hypothetical protein [Gemmatimonadota bacterium]